MPEKLEDQLTLASRLIEKRREMAEIDQALAAQKEVFFQVFYSLFVMHLLTQTSTCT